MAIPQPPSIMRPSPPPVTPLPGVLEVVAFNAVGVNIRESVGPSQVRHPKHGLTTGNVVVFTCPGQVAFHTNGFPVNVLDENTYTVNVSTGEAVTFDATVTYSPAAATNNRNITDGGQTRTIVRLVGHNFITGTQVNISQATNVQFDGNHNFQDIDGDSFELTGFAANAPSLAGIWAFATGSRYAFNNDAITIADDGVGLTTVTHPNHRLRDQSTVTISNAHVALDGAQQITVVDGDTYTFAATSNGVLNGAAQCSGRRQFWVEISTSARVSTVSDAGHGLSTGDQVTINHPLGGIYHGTHTITKIDHNSYSIPVGDGGGATVNLAVTRVARAFSDVNVIVEDPGRRTVVEQPNHGQVTGGNVTVANAGAYNGVRAVTVLSRSKYTINHVTGINQVVVGGDVTGSTRLVPTQPVVVTFRKTRGSATASVNHVGHELTSGMVVFIHSIDATANGLKPITVTRSDYYQITLTAPAAAAGVQRNVNVRWVPEFVPPPHGVPIPLDSQVEAKVSDVETSAVRKANVGAAALSAYRHEINPATCTNHNCSFWDLHRV